MLPSQARLSESKIRSALKAGGYDGAIVSHFVSANERAEWVPGSTQIVPMPAGGLYGYYNFAYRTVHYPGHMRTTAVVTLETNVYAAASGKLVWSARSETFDPKSAEDIVQSFSAAATRRLRKDGIVP